ncbi:hypothetical protein NEISUBOT_05445 [Neisseria subflava NJ9703]|uniref:Uncharacterized protein n=1 Tax=Neisseria subflava NJ9703 TaxID=546268 RepID=A0A9W5MYC6_NEISU|nr:hypothetical protein NEISUBOT_05445 [Neisseria subflava NJ9703]
MFALPYFNRPVRLTFRRPFQSRQSQCHNLISIQNKALQQKPLFFQFCY